MAAVVALAALVLAPAARAQTARQDFYITNGTVNTQVLAGNSLYIGGAFTNVGPVIGCGVPLDPSTGAAVPGFPQVTGQINAVVADGSGGWYIGGLFTQVGLASRANLAHVRADLSVDSWDPGADGQVLSLAASGGTVYAGGAFTHAGGQSRSHLAAIDNTGAATAWNPGTDDLVRALAVSGSTVYAGGKFSLAGGASRARIAAIDATTGGATAWNPGASLEVYGLGVHDGLVYACGAFTVVGGLTRNRLAAIDSVTGTPTAWNPNLNGQASAIAMGPASVYVGGGFSTVGTAFRLRLAEVPYSFGAASSWDPSANGAVGAIAVAHDTIYVGGDFTSVGGQARSRLAAISATTALATAWNPVAYSTVQGIAVSGGSVYAGGAFGGMGGITRNNLAAIDLITGEPTSWDPNVGDQVLALAQNGNTLYVGGTFTQVGGQPHNGIAALDLPSGNVLAWNPSCDGQVSAIAVINGAVYACGTYSTIGGQPRDNAAALDTTTALATAWAPEPDGPIFRVLASGGLLYAGGSFANIGGQARNNIAALDPVTGLANAWNPNCNGTIRDLAVTCGSVYAGGFFTNIGGMSRNRLAALDPATGAPTAWNPNANGPVYCFALSDGVLYAGGVVNVIGGLTRNRLAALDPVSGLATTWNPNANNTVRSIVVGGGALYAAGSFTSMGLTLQGNVAALPVDGSITCPAIAISPTSLADAQVGTAWSTTLSAAGGTGPWCWSITEGTLPPGLSLSPTTGVLAGTPTAAAASTFNVRVTDAHGCTSNRPYTLNVFAGAIGSTVTAITTGLEINPAHTCASVPFVYQRTDSASARAVSVTFKIDTSRLALCASGSPYASITAGNWLADFSNSLLQVTDNGGGVYTVDALLLGSPCGQTKGGTLFTASLKSVGADGLAAVAVTSVRVRDCSNAPLAAVAGVPESLRVQNAPVVITPATLPAGTEGAAYHQALSASPGTAPFTFTRASGTLPAGVTLSSAGVLDGTPVLPGTYAFTVNVSDVYGCVGSRAYSVVIGCPALALLPGALPDGVVGAAITQTLTTGGGRPPYAYALTDGALPPGVTLSGAGLLAGTPSVAGSSTFTVQSTDSGGCTTSRSYTVTQFTAPAGSSVAPVATGLCLGTGHPTVRVPFTYARTDTVPVRALSVTFRLDTTRVVLRTPLAPDSSLTVGPWFAGTTTVSHVTSYGDGSYTVDIAILGTPCGPTAGGTVFSIDLAEAAPSGTGSVTVTVVHARDCAGTPVAAAPGAPASIPLGTSAPPPVSGLVASAVTAGNGTGSTSGIQLAWTAEPGDTVTIYRAPYPSYPAYAGSAPDSSTAPGGVWTRVTATTASGFTDLPPARGCWYYVAFATNPCGGLSAVSNRTAGTLDYLLGDVADGVTPGTGNNALGMEDVTLLGLNYGIGAATIAARGVGYLDVGPTVNGGAASRPVPDGSIDFEDLMVFSSNFAASVSAPNRASGPAAVRRAGPARAQAAAASSTALESFHLAAPSSVQPGATVTASLTLAAAGRMQGFSVRLGWDPSVVEPVGLQSGGFVESQGGLVLTPTPGTVDAALLGVTGDGLEGSGEVARVAFRALRAGDPAITIAHVLARSPANRPLGADAVAGVGPPPVPSRTALLAPSPNPFGEGTTVAFSLAARGPVELSIYSVDGRRVRLLADGVREPGVYRLAWDGRDPRGMPVAPGVYFARLNAGGHAFTARLVRLR